MLTIKGLLINVKVDKGTMKICIKSDNYHEVVCACGILKTMYNIGTKNSQPYFEKLNKYYTISKELLAKVEYNKKYIFTIENDIITEIELCQD